MFTGKVQTVEFSDQETRSVRLLSCGVRIVATADVYIGLGPDRMTSESMYLPANHVEVLDVPSEEVATANFEPPLISVRGRTSGGSLNITAR